MQQSIPEVVLWPPQDRTPPHPTVCEDTLQRSLMNSLSLAAFLFLLSLGNIFSLSPLKAFDTYSWYANYSILYPWDLGDFMVINMHCFEYINIFLGRVDCFHLRIKMVSDLKEFTIHSLKQFCNSSVLLYLWLRFELWETFLFLGKIRKFFGMKRFQSKPTIYDIAVYESPPSD